jgi:hypothetical protein
VHRVSLAVMADRRVETIFDAAHACGADLILTRPFGPHRSGRRATLRLWNDAPCSVWTVPCGSRPTIARALADISNDSHGPRLLERAARLCRRAVADDLIVFRASFRDLRMVDEALKTEFLHERLLALYRTLRQVHLHGVTCTPIVDECPSVHRVLLTMAYSHDADLLIVDPASSSALPWTDARRDVADFLAACDLPLLQLRGRRTLPRRARAVRPWHDLSGRGTTPVDVLATSPRDLVS